MRISIQRRLGGSVEPTETPFIIYLNASSRSNQALHIGPRERKTRSLVWFCFFHAKPCVRMKHSQYIGGKESWKVWDNGSVDKGETSSGTILKSLSGDDAKVKKGLQKFRNSVIRRDSKVCTLEGTTCLPLQRNDQANRNNWPHREEEQPGVRNPQKQAQEGYPGRASFLL